jgi:hypothetical protein
MRRDDSRIPLRNRSFKRLPRLLALGLGTASLCAVGCSSGGADTMDPIGTDGSVAEPVVDLSQVPDAASAPVDMSFVMVKPCSWRDRFQQVYGHAWNPADVAFVTADNAVTRGVDQLDLLAQKNQVPDQVRVKGRTSLIKEIRLLASGGSQVLASRTGAYVYGLGYAMWLEVNGSGESGLTEATLLRQFSMEEPSYQQLVGLFRVLTKTAEGRVVAADRADFAVAAAQLLKKIESGGLTFGIGTGHAADYGQTAQIVNGKRFSFQLSDGFGLDPQLGFQRDGVWGQQWLTYSPGGNWSASAPGMQPKCGGCAIDRWAGASYQFCEGPLDRASAEAACQSRGGHLATVNDPFTDSFLRGLAPNVSGAFLGINDLKVTGQYVWATGMPATYTNWAQGQPDHYMNQEHCAQLTDGKSSTQWNDISCASALGYLCQLP